MSDHPVVLVIVVFVSLGCFFFVCCCLFALWCLIKKRKKECVQGTKIIRDDEHFKVKKEVAEGPRGAESVVITMEKDKHFEEEIVKREKEVEGKHMHGKNGDIEAGESSANLHVEYKP